MTGGYYSPVTASGKQLHCLRVSLPEHALVFWASAFLGHGLGECLYGWALRPGLERASRAWRLGGKRGKEPPGFADPEREPPQKKLQ